MSSLNQDRKNCHPTHRQGMMVAGAGPEKVCFPIWTSAWRRRWPN